MGNFVQIDTPGGLIWAEVDFLDDKELKLLGAPQDKASRTFRDAVDSLKANAQLIFQELSSELGPSEIEISFGITVGVEAGSTLFGLAKASGEASYSVVMKWHDK